MGPYSFNQEFLFGTTNVFRNKINMTYSKLQVHITKEHDYVQIFCVTDNTWVYNGSKTKMHECMMDVTKSYIITVNSGVEHKCYLANFTADSGWCLYFEAKPVAMGPSFAYT